jgi:hypothetical protein
VLDGVAARRPIAVVKKARQHPQTAAAIFASNGFGRAFYELRQLPIGTVRAACCSAPTRSWGSARTAAKLWAHRVSEIDLHLQKRVAAIGFVDCLAEHYR